MTDPEKIQALTLAKALELYGKSKILVNSQYTPMKMLSTASSITGNQYRRGEYLKAMDDLRKKVGLA